MGYTPQTGLLASRAGLGFCRKVNKKSGINAAPTVLQDTGLLYATESGKRDVITCFYAHLNTNSDWCEFKIGYTANADGTGTFTAISPLFRIETPAANQDGSATITRFDPPAVIKDTDGGAWSIRAQTNDADASVTFGVNGWREAYP